MPKTMQTRAAAKRATLPSRSKTGDDAALMARNEPNGFAGYSKAFGVARVPLERLSSGWFHPVDKKSLQIQKLEHILVAQIEWIRAEYALERFPTGWFHPVDKKSLQIQKLEHILVAQIEWIRAEYALK
jgi:hypothetical protein